MYINRWKKGFGVTMHVSTNDSQKAPSDFKEAVDAINSRIATLRTCFDYTACICNMDQTMVRMNSPATSTNNITGKAAYISPTLAVPVEVSRWP